MSAQQATRYRNGGQSLLNFGEIVVDNFAGGGGASTGIEQALGRPVDIAINHDPAAVRMHEVNHPHTRHYCESVWDVDPVAACAGRPVGLAWFSPDCKHFSKAKGGKPVEKKIRGLAWVALKWAGKVRPRVIILENVEEFKTWGPLRKDRPCPIRKGQTFQRWKKQLENLGYQVEHQELRACDYGAPTIRKRLFVIARCDGQPIVWPEPTHGPGLAPYRTAAEIIDWALPCPSIFERRRPLAENTLRRIARGLQRFVLENSEPFIVRIGQTGFGGNRLQYTVGQPLTTITSKAEHCLVVPHVERMFTQSAGNSIADPLGTITAGGGGKSALVAAFLAKHFGGNYDGPGHDLRSQAGTVTARDHHALVTSHLLKLRGTCRDGQPVTEPMPTVTAGGNHVGEVRAFLLKYYGTNIGHDCRDPLQTITSKHRFGLVTVQGQDYQIVDIGMRMLEPAELFRANGFPANYIIDRDSSGQPISKSEQVNRCGNSVPPAFARALVAANVTSAQGVQAA